MKASAGTSGINNTLKEAAVQVDVQTAKAFNHNRRLLVCRNKTIELLDAGPLVRGNRRSDMSTMFCDTLWDDSAHSELWDKFLATVVPGGMHDWLQRVVGMSLSGRVEDRMLLFVHGPTASGKTTFLQIIAQTLGMYAGSFGMSLLREKSDEGGRPDVIDAMHKRFIFASETSSEHRLHKDMIKRATGGDALTARKLHGNEIIRDVPEFTAWIATNDIPTIEGADIATWERLICIPFPNTVSHADRLPYAQLLSTDEGRSAVLRWCVDGWRRYREEGTVRDMPEEVVEATMKLREGLSELDVFLAECCVIGPEHKIQPAEFAAGYEQWQALNGDPRNKITRVKLRGHLENRGFKHARIREDGKQFNWYTGLAFHPDYMPVRG